MTLTFYNFMSFWTQKAIENGVPKEMIVLILMFPIIATIIAFIRHVIGLKSLGIYIPSILSISFLATGIKIGLLFFVSILILGTLARFVLIKLRLSYLPRMALILTLVSSLTFILVIFGSYFNLTNITAMAIFPMLIMIILVERFINAQIERGFQEAFLLSLETLAISIFCYFLMVSGSVQNLVLNSPGVILLSIIIFNLLIGKWTGLRLTEYFRFRKIIKGS